MKLRLKHKGCFVPYGGGYSVVDPSTNVRVSGTTWNQIYDAACASRRANGIPIGLGFEDELEQWLCASNPSECENKDGDSVSTRSLNLGDIIMGTRVMTSFKLAGSPIVPQEEAERRAAICAKCPANQAFKKPCTGVCAELQAIVQSITGNHKTSLDASLHACNVCGCFLSAAVHLPVEIQWRPLPENQKNQFRAMEKLSGCWKVQQD